MMLCCTTFYLPGATEMGIQSEVESAIHANSFRIRLEMCAHICIV